MKPHFLSGPALAAAALSLAIAGAAQAEPKHHGRKAKATTENHEKNGCPAIGAPGSNPESKEAPPAVPAEEKPAAPTSAAPK